MGSSGRLAPIVCLAVAALVHVPPAFGEEGGEPYTAMRAPPTESRMTRVQALLGRAMSLTGVPYRWGGETPETGFDCSGLVTFVFVEVIGRALPRTALEMSRIGRRVARSELQPGDLVFFNTLRRPFSYVGIYLGDHRFIHAPARGRHVEVVHMTKRYWRQRYDGARRVEIAPDVTP